MMTVVGSMVDIIGGEPYDHFNEHKNLHFDNGSDIHLNSENFEESG